MKRWLGPWGRGGTERLLAFDNTAAPVCLRVNTLVTTRDKLLADLTEMGAQVHASEWSPYGIVAEHLPSLHTLLAALPRHFYIQDEALCW